MRLQLVLSSLAATAVADFKWKMAPGGPAYGCKDTISGTIDLVRAAPEGLRKRDEVYPYPGQQVGLEKLTLKDGILKDREGRIGSVVDNFQFQFDGPEPQDLAKITRGFSVCKNNTLALGQSTFFEECDAGANFWNLYYFVGLDTSNGRPTVCRPVNFLVPPPGGLGAKTVSSVVYVTESVTPLAGGYGYGTVTDTGAFGTATGAGTAKGTGKGATAKGTGTATGAGALETGPSTGKEAKGAKGTAGMGGNSTTSLTAPSTDLATTTTSAANLTTTDAPKPPPPPPATPSAPGPKTTTNGAAGYKSHPVALLVGLLGVALL